MVIRHNQYHDTNLVTIRALFEMKLSAESILFYMALVSQIFQSSIAAPNIVFVMLDDVGFGDMEFSNPESHIKTPFLKNLVATEAIKVEFSVHLSILMFI